MTTWINVARYHLINRVAYVLAPWGILAFAFVVNLIITAVQGGPNPTKALSRRTYYTGTALLALSLAAVYGLALTLLQAIERATGGWGVQMRFFQVSYIFTGRWYLTWATSFVESDQGRNFEHAARRHGRDATLDVAEGDDRDPCSFSQLGDGPALCSAGA
jgi:hypothetical protein